MPEEQLGFAKECYEDGWEDAMQIMGASLYSNGNNWLPYPALWVWDEMVIFFKNIFNILHGTLVTKLIEPKTEETPNKWRLNGSTSHWLRPYEMTRKAPSSMVR